MNNENIRPGQGYFSLMEKSDECGKKALEYYSKGEIDLAKFYKGASDEFKRRARQLEMTLV